jgi:glycosyltransferase involved in cell wall biosynthesis
MDGMRPPDVRPLVSVVITCCNQAHVLAGAVRSVAARAARTQIIVVDHGSADGTAALTRRLNVLFLRQPNGGAAAAKNRGLSASSGTFVIFLDAADRLLAGGIDIGVRALASRPGCAMAYGRASVAALDSASCSSPDVRLVRAGHHAALLQTNLIWMSAMAILRRDAVERAGGFVEGIDGAADYDLYLRISRDAEVFDHGCGVAVCGGGRVAANGEAARLLRDTLAVMRRNCPDPETPLHSAWREGYARWQEFYGTQLADEIRTGVRDHAFAEATRGAMTLFSFAPRVFMRELGRARGDTPRQRTTNNIARDSPSSNVPRSAMPSSVSRP